MTVRVDIRAARNGASWSAKQKLMRVLWACATPLFRWSPRICWGWRRALLRLFGATVGPDVHVYPTVQIAIPWNLRIDNGAAVGHCVILYALGPIHIGARATVSQYAHLCAGSHDWRHPARPLLRLPITVGPDAWVCADAFVGPSVSIGARAILGARGVAMRDLPANHIGQGNPMQIRKAT